MAECGIDIPKIDFAGYFTYPPGSIFGPYITTTAELVWIEEGSALATTDGVEHQLRTGSVLMSPSATRTSYTWDARRPSRHGFVALDLPFLELRSANLPAGDVVPALLRHVVHLELVRPEGWTEDAAQAINVAVRALAVDRAPADSLLGPVVLASLEAVRERWPFQGPWPAVPLDQLAAEAAVTPEHLCRAWTKDVGTSPIAALRFVRLHRAAFLLSRGGNSVTDTARMVGFDSPFHFSRAFKKAFGRSPQAFQVARAPLPEVPTGLRAVMSHL